MEGKWTGFFDRIKQKGKNQWLIFLLLGALLLVIALPMDSGQEEKAAAETELFLQQEDQGKEAELEKKLEDLLKSVEGVGNVKVALTLKSDGRKTVEKDTSATERGTTEKGSDGNETLSKESALDEETIYQRGADGEESPYVVETQEPEILGVLVAAQGGDDPRVAAMVTEAAEALFGIEAHRIKVMKMN